MNYFRTLKALSGFMKNTRISTEEMKELQEQNLRALLHHAWDHSVFYRRTFEKAGIREGKLDSLPLSAFPAIDKQILMEHFDELVTVPDVKQAELRRFDAEQAADPIAGNTMWCILQAAQGSRGISFMMSLHGRRCCWASSAVRCGTCPCRRSSNCCSGGRASSILQQRTAATAVQWRSVTGLTASARSRCIWISTHR